MLKYLRNELECDLEARAVRDGSTALHLAAEAKHGSQQPYTHVCEWLVKNSVDVNALRPKDQMSPLHVAARAGKDKVVKALLDNDADPTLGCMDIGLASNGITPLMLAQRGATKTGFSGHDRAAKHLVRAVTEALAPPAPKKPLSDKPSRRSRRNSFTRHSNAVAVEGAVEGGAADITTSDDDTASLKSSRPRRASRELSAIELQDLRDKQKRSTEIGPDGEVTLSTALREEEEAKDALLRAQLRASEAKKLAKALRKNMHKSPTKDESRQRAATMSIVTTSSDGADEASEAEGVFCAASPSTEGGPRTQSAPDRILTLGKVRKEKGVRPTSGVSVTSEVSEVPSPRRPTRRLSRSDSDSVMVTMSPPVSVRRERAMSAGSLKASGSMRRVQSAGSAVHERRSAPNSADNGLNNSWNSGSGIMSEGMDTCATCEKQCDIQLCVQCLSIGYCSRECQKIDWKEHKKECRSTSAKVLKSASDA